MIHSMISDIYLARNRSIMRISAACSCHIGKRRKNNEDNFFFAGRYMASCNNGLGSILEKNFPLKKDRFFAVFDGMGGESCGEMAAFLAAEACGEHFKTAKDGIRNDPEEFLKKIDGVDLILTEGFKHGPWPKIMLHRKENGKPMPLRPEECLAVISDVDVEDCENVFPLDDVGKTAVFLLQYIQQNMQHIENL